MTSPLRILILENPPAEADRLIQAIKKGGFSFDPVIVRNKSTFLKALDPPPDIILADFNLPQFSGPAAIEEVRRRDLGIPVIIISGSVGEEQAVEAIKMGALDYLLKDRLARLPKVIEGALAEKQARDKRRALRRKLQWKEERYREIVEGTDDLITTVDREGYFLFVNSCSQKYLGLSPEECVGKLAFDVVHPEDRGRTQEAFRGWVRNRVKNVHYENRVHSLQGEDYHLAWTINFHYDDTGELLFINSIARDITNLKSLQGALKESLGIQESIIEASPASIYALAPDGTVLTWNKSAERVFGWTTEEVLGKPNPVVPPGREEEFKQFLKQAMRGQTISQQEVIRQTKDGTPIHISLSAAPIHDQQGNVIGVMSVIFDITERKKAEGERNRLLDILENTPDIVSFADAEGRIQYFNRAGQEIFGLAPDIDLEQKPIASIHPTWAADIVLQQGVPAAMRDGTWLGETAILDKKGREIPTTQAIIAHRREDGAISHLSTIIRDISEQKKLAAEMNRLVAVLEATPDIVIIGEVHGGALFINDAGRRIFGIDKDADIARMTIDDFHPAWAGEVIRDQGVPAALREGSWTGETALIGADGRQIPVSQVIIAHRGERDSVSHLSTIMRDISARVAGERELRESKHRLELALESASMGTWGWSAETDTGEWDEYTVRLLGFPSGTRSEGFEQFQEMIHPDDRRRVAREIEKLVKEDTVYQSEYRIVRPDGEVRWMASRGRLERDDAGRAQRMTGVLMDITEIKKAEETLYTTAETLKALIDAAPLSITTLDQNGRVTLWNPASKKIYGWSADEARGIFMPTVPPQEQEEFKRFLDRVFSGESLTGVELRRYRKDGTTLDIRLSAAPIRDQEGRINAALGIGEDVTDNKLAEAALRQTTETLQSIINASPLPITAVDREGRVTLWNHAAEQVYGWLGDEVQGKIIPTIPEEKRKNWTRMIDRVFAGEILTGVEGQRITKDGRLLDVRLFTSPLRDLDGRITSIMGIAEDITAFKRTQRELEKTQGRLKAFLTSDVIGILFGDIHGNILDANDKFLDMVGYSRTDLEAGRVRWIDITPEKFLPLDEEAVNEAREKATCTPYEKQYVCKDGSLIWVLVGFVLLEPDREQSVAFILDITEGKENLQKLRQSEEAYRLLFDASPLPMWVYDLQTYRFLTVNEEAVVKYGYSREEFLGMDLRQIRPVGEDSQLEDSLREDESAWVSGQTWIHQTRRGEQLEVLSFRYPLEYNGRPAALVVSLDVTERNRREREMAAITAMTNSLRGARTSSELQGLILDGLLDLLNTDGSALIFEDPESDRMTIKLGRGVWSGWSNQPITVEDGCPRHVIRKSTGCVNAGPLKSEACRCPCFGSAALAVACVPLVSHNQTLGVLSIGRKKPIEENDLRILHAIADIAATAIHRSELHEQTEHHLNRILALRNIDMAITSSLDLRLTLDILLEQLETHMKIDAAAVLLLNRDLGMLEYGAGRGFRTRRIKETRLRLGESRAGEAALNRQPVIIPDFGDKNCSFARNALVREEGFQAYCAVPLIAKGEIHGVLETFHHAPFDPSDDWLEFLESIGLQAAIAIENSSLFTNLQRSNLDLRLAYDKTIEGWSRALDLRDKETEGHSLRVTENTVRLARECGMSAEDLVPIRWGALLHDIGKMGIPDKILLKPGPLDDEEWGIMKQHPVFAHQLLSPIPHLKDSLDIPYAHHEKWDGSGYPRGLKEEQIPLSARIFAVIDVWDALRSDRPYRAAWSSEKARNHIMKGAGSHFDPRVVEAFLRLEW